MVAGRELQLLEADALAHDPSTLTARAVTSTTITSETVDLSPMSSFAFSVSGIVSVGLNALALVSET